MFKCFKSDHVNALTLFTISGLLLAAFFMRNNPIANQIWLALSIVGSTLSLFAGLFNYWRLLKISEAPLSTIAAAAQGYIELQGVANCEKPLTTPYHGIPCVWYRAWVFANTADDETINLFGTRLLDYSESELAFTLTDNTGHCSVNPKGAEVVHFKARTWRKNDHRYVEEYLPAGKQLYVLGQLDTRHDVLDVNAVNIQLSKKLALLKANKQQLLNRYDHNRDGQIDLDEWEKARHEARQCVAAEHAMRRGTGSFTLKKPTDNHLFLISAQSPQQLRDTYKTWCLIHLSFLIGILSLLVFL